MARTVKALHNLGMSRARCLRGARPGDPAENAPPGEDWAPAGGVLRFALAMLLGVGLATVATAAGARAVLPPEVWEPTPHGQQVAGLDSPRARGAVEAVTMRFGNSLQGRNLRRSLRAGAVLDYRPPGRWTVRYGRGLWTVWRISDASWQHEARPANVAARQLETRGVRVPLSSR